MENFSDYSYQFALMISKMTLSEIAKLAETSSEMREKIKNIKITATDAGVLGAVTPYNVFIKYDRYEAQEIVRKKIIAENNVKLFHKYCEVDPEPVRTIIELLKIHKGQNDLIDHMLTLTRPEKIGNIVMYTSVVHNLSFFLKNTFYPRYQNSYLQIDFQLLVKYKAELGYISDEFYEEHETEANELLVLFTETYWKRPNNTLSPIVNRFYIQLIAEYNSDRELSLRIFKKIYDDEFSYISHYFACVKFWKTEYGRQLFSEKCETDCKETNTKLVNNILKITEHPLELSDAYPQIFTEQLMIELIESGFTHLGKIIMEQKPELLLDSEGYIESKFIKPFSNGIFYITLNIREEDVIGYVSDSIKSVKGEYSEIFGKNMINYLLRPGVADICATNQDCVNNIRKALKGCSHTFAELDPEVVLSLLTKLDIDYYQLYDDFEIEFEDCDYEVSEMISYARWDQKIRKLLNFREFARECKKSDKTE